jgi:uncharacterized protein YhaN
MDHTTEHKERSDARQNLKQLDMQLQLERVTTFREKHASQLGGIPLSPHMYLEVSAGLRRLEQDISMMLLNLVPSQNRAVLEQAKKEVIEITKRLKKPANLIFVGAFQCPIETRLMLTYLRHFQTKTNSTRFSWPLLPWQPLYMQH